MAVFTFKLNNLIFKKKKKDQTIKLIRITYILKLYLIVLNEAIEVYTRTNKFIARRKLKPAFKKNFILKLNN